MISRLFKALRTGSKQRWVERNFILTLSIGALLAMLISLAIGLQQSVWFDEAYSIMVAKQPVAQLLHLTAVDTHPPLYYLLLKLWAGLFGWSELALRSLSVLTLGGAIIFAGLLIKRMFGVRAALIALPFIVFAPFLLRYGFEIRMYALASLIGIAATYVLVQASEVHSGRRQWLLYGLYAVLVAIGVYTLYYLALLWIAHLVWLIWLTLQRKQSLVKAPWVLALIGSIVLFSPWLSTFVSQVNNGALAAISQPLTIDNLAGIVSFIFVYQPAWQLSALMSLIILFVIIVVTYFMIQMFTHLTKAQRPYVLLLVLYVVVPIGILTLISLVKPMYTERYIAHIIIAGSILVGVSVALTLARKSTPRRQFLAASLVVISLIGVMHLATVGNYNFQRLQTPSVAQAAAALSCADGHAVVAADPYVAIELAYYLPQCQIYFYSETLSLSGGYAPLSNSPLHVTNPVTQLADKQMLSYVYYGEPQLEIPGFTQTERRSFDALSVESFSAE